MTPLALVDAYTVFANDGWRREPTPVRAVLDGRGTPLPLPARKPVDVLPRGRRGRSRAACSRTS